MSPIPASTRARLRSPLASWFTGTAAVRRFRRRVLGRRVALVPPRDGTWRALVPSFAAAVALARGGVPFQIAFERRYDRSGDARRLTRALARGATVFFPQAHQVLPRVARLMVALREELLGPRRDESSFLFLVEGRDREGMFSDRLAISYRIEVADDSGEWRAVADSTDRAKFMPGENKAPVFSTAGLNALPFAPLLWDVMRKPFDMRPLVKLRDARAS